MLAIAHHAMTGTPIERYSNGPADLASRNLGSDGQPRTLTRKAS